MNRNIKIATIICLACFIMSGCSDPKPTITEYTSEAGRFSILFPGEPEEEKKTYDTDWGPIDSYFSTFQNKNGFYSVAYNDYPEGSISTDPNEALDSGRDGALNSSKSKLISESPIQINDYPGREIKSETSDGKIVSIARMYLVRNRLYQIQVVSPPENISNNQNLEFLNSFKLIQ